MIVTDHHADVKKTLVLGLTAILEQAFVTVAIILRRLNDCNLRVREVGHHMFEPLSMDAVISVDDCHYFCVFSGMSQEIVKCTRFESGKWTDMKKLEPRAELLTVSLDRLPDGRVLSIVVDDQHLEVRVVQLLQRVEGPFHHIRRFVAARNMQGNFRGGTNRTMDGAERPWGVRSPAGFEEFVRFDTHVSQHAGSPDKGDRQREPSGQWL
ncbi:hypothetical protein SAMN05444503_103547 [Pseudomonas sp. BS3767]|nr:hypothetical protein SAMN05444503_103547 [Pseudomonas sp. BS3767]SDM63235.1 hypothetical protein SAMN05444502_102233 [Pseudomonas sp. BS3759]